MNKAVNDAQAQRMAATIGELPAVSLEELATVSSEQRSMHSEVIVSRQSSRGRSSVAAASACVQTALQIARVC